MGFDDMDLIAGLNEDNIEEIIISEDIEVKEGALPSKLGIICVICKERVGYVIRDKLKFPLRGNMIHPHLGCGSWPLPTAWDGPNNFVCPHAAEGDKHCFVNVIERDPDLTNHFLTENFTFYRVELRKCPCGCGGEVAEGNTYANNLQCYRRHISRG